MRVIETERLVLRHLLPEDAEFVLELLNDPDWLRYIGDRGVRTVEGAREYILKGPAEMYARAGFGLYLVELREGGTPVGLCGLIKREYLEDVDIGFAFLPRFRSQGYAYEAASAVMSYAFGALGLGRVAAITAPENHGSIKLLEKLGMRFERTVSPPGEGVVLRLFAAGRGRGDPPVVTRDAAR